MLKYILILTSFPILSSCLSIRPATVKSGKNTYETFYLGPEGTQYFIKPISLNGSSTDNKLLFDITFKDKIRPTDSAVLNFSLIDSQAFKVIDSINIRSGVFQYQSNSISSFFTEKKPKYWVSRFSLKIPITKLKLIFEDPKWNFEVSYHDTTYQYVSTKKSISITVKLNEFIFKSLIL